MNMKIYKINKRNNILDRLHSKIDQLLGKIV